MRISDWSSDVCSSDLESISDAAMDDYVGAQVDAIDAIRDLLGVERVHAIGYCVAGTTLAATLALLEARGEAGKVASATFLTAQEIGRAACRDRVCQYV